MAKKLLSNMEIDRRLDALAARHGLTLTPLEEVSAPKATTTIHVIPHDADAGRLARAHAGADAAISADDLRYALPPLPVVAKGGPIRLDPFAPRRPRAARGDFHE